jgi:hypothetical protein
MNFDSYIQFRALNDCLSFLINVSLDHIEVDVEENQTAVGWPLVNVTRSVLDAVQLLQKFGMKQLLRAKTIRKAKINKIILQKEKMNDWNINSISNRTLSRDSLG